MNKKVLLIAGVVIVGAPAAIALINLDSGNGDSHSAETTRMVMAAVSGDEDEDESGNISKVNDSIRVRDGESVGSVKTVNGSITIGDNATVEFVRSVNGSISIGDGTVVHEGIANVNGGITVRKEGRIGGDMKTVNGTLDVGPGSTIGGKATSVNGKIALYGAQAGAVTITSGKVELADGAVVLGDLTVREQKRSFFSFGKSQRPRIIIGDNSEVRGKLHFGQEVELTVADSAKIGEITGVEPVRRD